MIKPPPLIAFALLIGWTSVPNCTLGQTTLLPDFDAATFIPLAPIDNPYFPLTPGTVFVYEGETPDGIERIKTRVTRKTKTITVYGRDVEATVIRDRSFLDNVLVEDTFDWYAQDTAGNVWYLGEFTTAFEYDDEGNLIDTNHDGSWEAGVDGAQPGWRMNANPQVGDMYYQEYAVGIAEDEAKVLSLNESVSGPLGDFHNVLKIRESSRLDPTVLEHKLYAPDVGLVRVDEELDAMGMPAFTLDLVRIKQARNGNGNGGDDDDDHGGDGNGNGGDDDDRGNGNGGRDNDDRDNRNGNGRRNNDNGDNGNRNDDEGDDRENNGRGNNGEDADNSNSRFERSAARAESSLAQIAEDIMRVVDATAVNAESSPIDCDLCLSRFSADFALVEDRVLPDLSPDTLLVESGLSAGAGLRSSAAPEPGTWLLAALGAAPAWWMRRIRATPVRQRNAKVSVA